MYGAAMLAGLYRWGDPDHLPAVDLFGVSVWSMIGGVGRGGGFEV
jgi:hypothetical protein